MIKKIHLISFATEGYIKAGNELMRMAKELDIFATRHLYSYDELLEFKKDHDDFIQKNNRGFGYWLWKPYIIWKKLCEVDEDDLVIYCDACCSLNINYKDKFLEYISIASNDTNGNLFLEFGNIIEKWCKMDAIVKTNSLDIKNLHEIIPGIIFTSAKPQNISLFKQIYNFMGSDYHMIDDTPSILPNSTMFVEHRHDQSIISIMIRQTQPESIYPIGSQLLATHIPIGIRNNFYPR